MDEHAVWFWRQNRDIFLREPLRWAEYKDGALTIFARKADKLVLPTRDPEALVTILQEAGFGTKEELVKRVEQGAEFTIRFPGSE